MFSWGRRGLKVTVGPGISQTVLLSMPCFCLEYTLIRPLHAKSQIAIPSARAAADSIQVMSLILIGASAATRCASRWEIAFDARRSADTKMNPAIRRKTDAIALGTQNGSSVWKSALNPSPIPTAAIPVRTQPAKLRSCASNVRSSARSVRSRASSPREELHRSEPLALIASPCRGS